ncbi:MULTISPECIES: hydrogenase nickel incorporation protein HypB [Aphanothece]|uniref:hydrogenase nickel incorporation protein HypB n=1 Tax=Aphanothece TaxID=1121 RepID=UPI003984B0A6
MCTDCGCALDTAAPAPPASPAPRTLHLELGQALLARNDSQAAGLRRRFAAAGLPVVNLLSSPGSGKTALLESLGRQELGRSRIGVIVGDLATDHDARRLQAAGLEAVQITTGQACHLEAAMVERALGGFDLAALDLLVIENVGNLVCPAAYDLGEGQRLVMLSVTEGEDKPLKYPASFASADVVVISKRDLADAVGFDRRQVLRHLERVAPGARIVETSARTGEGLEELLAVIGLPQAG